MTRLCLTAVVLALTWSAGAIAQNKVHTETIRPPAVVAPQPGAAKADAVPEIITDVSRLPAPVARMREQILAAARSGKPANVVTAMQSNAAMPVFSLADDSDPIAYWKANYPDSEGVEALSILVTILETGFVHVDVGTSQEMYIWPYFARMPIKSLTAAQRVELFRIITGADYKDMLDFGAYAFYRLGIGPDGTWHYFVAGD
jgi:outer membrane murein-binding lipoprotein Lpp